MAPRSFSIAVAGACVIWACSGKRTSVGGSGGRESSGATGGATAGGTSSGGTQLGEAGQGAESGDGGSAGTGGATGGNGGSTSGSGGSNGGKGGASGGNGGASSGSGGAGGSGGRGGTSGTGGSSQCAAGTADCDDGSPDCETDLTAHASCGESCGDIQACDALSGATCVNGGCSNPWVAWPIPAEPSLTAVGDGSVKDLETGLVWQGVGSPEPREHAAAIDYCTTLTDGGHTDWRLPTLMELVSLVDYCRHDPAIDTELFSSSSDRYWSSTPRAGRVDMWVVYFSDGRTDYNAVTTELDVRCVR